MTRGMFEDELVSLLRRPSHVCDNSHIPDSELEFAFAMGVVLTRDGIWNYQGIACVLRKFSFSGGTMKRSLLLLLAGLLITRSAVGQRLSGAAVPEHYSLTFAINFPTNSFEGDETIDLHLLKSSDAITLNAWRSTCTTSALRLLGRRKPPE